MYSTGKTGARYATDQIIGLHASRRVVADETGTIIDATPAAIAFFRSTPSELIGSDVSHWIPDEDKRRHAMSFGKAFTDGRGDRESVTACRVRRADETLSDEQQITVSMRAINGRVYAVVVFEDQE